MKLHVVRHGRTEANASGLLLGRADPSLDEVGRAQATRLGDAVGDAAVVVSSPLRRCQQTASAIMSSASIDSEPIVDSRLVELDYGEWDLKPLSDISPQQWGQWRQNPHFRPPGGETLVELFDRVGELLDEVAGGRLEAADRALDHDDTIVLVTHVSPIKIAMAWALGIGVEVSWRSQVAQASVTTINVGDRGPSLHGFNWQPWKD